MATALPKSTSDDSHLTGDSKQSENKDFAGMGTSDDAHLAGDSKRQATAASSSGYAPPVQEERRVGIDGNLYTYKEFLEYYGEEWLTIQEWTAAKDTPPPPPPPQENVQAAAVITLLTLRTAEEIRTSTRIAGTCKKEMRAFYMQHQERILGIQMSLHLTFPPMYRGSTTLHTIQNARVLLAAALQERS